jgi:putative tryptophan/tyrosine transport system substrate-binding protein
MHRRHFIGAIVGSSALWTASSFAQHARVKRIGGLVIGNADAASFSTQLQEGLAELGYDEGRNYVLELRSAEGQLARLPELARELVAARVDVIVALFTPCAFAAKNATRDIPVVILAGDPVGTGLVESLSRPGGNLTGLSQVAAETHSKCIEIFRDMLPSPRRISVFANAADPLFAKSFITHVEHIKKAIGLEVPIVNVQNVQELEAAFAAARGTSDAVVFQASLPTKRVAELALANRLPAGTSIRAFAEVGGLMSYGSHGPWLFRQAAKFVHKIFQGQKPADIPLEQATKFELVINLKAAREIGLTVPGTVLARADDVIE